MRFTTIVRACVSLSVVVSAVVAPLAAQTGAPSRPRAPASAERNGTRDVDPASFWFGASAGIASTRLTCDFCATSRDVGLVLSGAVGTYLRRQVRVGFEVARWRFQDPAGVEERWLAAGLVSQVVPDPARGFFLHGGAGWTGYRAGEFAYDAPRLTVGVGWELPANERWFVGSLLTIDAASFGSLKNDGATVARDVGLSAVRLSVQLHRR